MQNAMLYHVRSLLGGAQSVPSNDATPFNGINATLVDDTTARTVQAAVTSKRKWITRIRVVNRTKGEDPIILIVDTDGNVLAVAQPGGLTNGRRVDEIVCQ